LGVFKSKEFSKEFESAVETLSPGEHSKVVQSRVGFHILRLNSKKEIVDPAFEKEKARFRDILFEKTLKKQVKLYLEQKREEALIRINE
jgi:peptidyl-prolyl cis-trans isomerase SurA